MQNVTTYAGIDVPPVLYQRSFAIISRRSGNWTGLRRPVCPFASLNSSVRKSQFANSPFRRITPVARCAGTR